MLLLLADDVRSMAFVAWQNRVRNDLLHYCKHVEAMDVIMPRNVCRNALLQVARKLDGPVVVQKGSADAISDGEQTIACTREGSPRRAGGQVPNLQGCCVCAIACNM